MVYWKDYAVGFQDMLLYLDRAAFMLLVSSELFTRRCGDAIGIRSATMSKLELGNEGS